MTPQKVLKQYFGYDNFRGGQEQLIDAIMLGKDVLGVMPTGAGKSICFQVPAILMSGITLVISPLVSLMKDQVGALVQLGISAAFINSSLTTRQMEMALYNANCGKYKLIYVAPERLLSPEFLEFAQNADISMLTVDEAHCVSQWGQDFRPSYLRITEFIDKLARRPVVSTFTATATPQVKDDIVKALKLADPTVLVTGFNRENLYFSVDNPKNKKAALMEFLQKNTDKAGIIYCLSRKNVEEVCVHLNSKGINATRYHAGLTDIERHTNQDDFLFDRKRVMVATNAFGMGIDKSNVSFVVHYNMPKDMESYYQEAGRAGRDGTFAECLLLYAPIDVRTNQWMIENTKNLSDADEKSPELKERDYERLKLITFYATTNNCLREYILHYFGDKTTSYCGNCSNCSTKFETMDITQEAQKILSCIYRMKERYGSIMVINVLRKSKNERILQLGLDQLPTYGISDKSADTLRAIIGYLLEENYITQTDEQYSVLKLTSRAKDVLQGNVQLIMKLAKEKEREQARAKTAKKHKDVPDTAVQLYEQLRDLRGRIANEQGVPAYFVFTDKSLVDMCVLLPKTLAEFANVSGVGDAKLERYGDEFVSMITDFCDNGPVERGAMVPLSQDVLNLIKITQEPTQISIILQRINLVLNASCGINISIIKLSGWLMENGFLEVDENAEKANKIPTDKGIKQGITQELREGKLGEYYINLYSQDFQEYIVSQIESIIN